MPRKGPKKVTRRDDRDLERCAERRKAQSANARAKTAEQVLNVYKAQSNPNIPTSKGERRALREALSAEGVSMERWNSGKFEECFFHIARDRYVNNKFVDTYSSAVDEESSAQWESDSWLQMYLHVPEDYRDKVSKVIEPLCSTPCDENRVPFKNKTPTFRISRSQAKALAEGTMIVHPTANTNNGDAVPVLSSADMPTSDLPTSTKVVLPEGKVTITNTHNEILCADATGKVLWRSQADAGAAEGATWTVEPTLPGKCNLRSAHGRFLCHCMWSGVVADRTSASWWEEWEICVAESDKPTPDEVLFTLKSWRNVYVGKSGDKVALTDKIDENCKFVVAKAV